ncbi:hypothetical protein VNI00_000965 [Paramarasmius palmivorus]|uniref:ATP synthase F0 subunit 8 n=1 Tax=Paramarasmius palmivorus TaxID=297713 RepID=A0AAW0E5S4_9AGAR
MNILLEDMLTSIINAFSVIYIAVVISVAIMGIISFVAWIRDVPQPPPTREVVEPTTPLPKYQETIGTDSGGSVDSDTTVVEDSPRSSISFDSSSSSTVKGISRSSSFRLKLKFLNEPGSNIKKISRGLTQSVVPALRRTQTMSKEAAVKLVAPFSKERRDKTSSLSRPSRRLSRTFTHIVKTCKLGQSSSSAIDMVRELSNGHCREITLSEQAMGMSRQLSSNHALCTGW